MRIAVCDNEEEPAKALKNRILSIDRRHVVDIFTSIKSFFYTVVLPSDREAVRAEFKGIIDFSSFDKKADIEPANYDLIFMDIEWDEMQNGIDFAQKLSKFCPDLQIIYVTGYGERYSQRIFLLKSNLCGFLIKPVDPKYLEELLAKAKANIDSRQKNRLIVTNRSVSEAVPYYEIYYLENRNHKTIIHTGKGNLEMNKRLEIIRDELPDNFLNCHKSFSVNMDFIQRIDRDRISITNDEQIPVSRSLYAISKDKYFRYVGKSL